MYELYLMIILLIQIILLMIVIKKDNSNITELYLFFIIIISYILSFRNMSFIGININSSIFLYPSIFPIFYLYQEQNKNIKIKDYIIKISIILLIIMLIIMLATGFIASVTDNNAINIQNIFGNNFISLLSYPISVIITIYLTEYFKIKVKDAYKNNFYTLIVLGSIVTSIDIIIYNIINYSLTQNIITILFLITVSYIIRILLITIYSIIIEIFLPKRKVKK